MNYKDQLIEFLKKSDEKAGHKYDLEFGEPNIIKLGGDETLAAMQFAEKDQTFHLTCLIVGHFNSADNLLWAAVEVDGGVTVLVNERS